MIVQSLLISALCYLLIYPKRSTWGIHSISVRGFYPYFSWASSLFVLDIYLDASVRVVNPNRIGSELERASYEIFAIFDKYDIRHLGMVDVGGTAGASWIGGRNATLVPAKVCLSELDIPLALQLFLSICRHGSIKVLALGSAQVRTAHRFQTLVGVKCVEMITISLWSSWFVKLPGDGNSKNCHFTYQPLPRLVRLTEGKLPLLDRRYIHSGLLF